MYEVVSHSLKEVITMYAVFAGACILTYPLIQLLFNAVDKKG